MFDYTCFVESEKLCFIPWPSIFTYSKDHVYSYFERKNDKVLTFNIVHFPNFEISAAPNSFKFTQFTTGGKNQDKRGYLLALHNVPCENYGKDP